MHEQTKGTIVLAKVEGLGEITMCGCGVVSIHLGSVSVRLESRALVQVEHMIQGALDRMCELSTQRDLVGHAATGQVH